MGIKRILKIFVLVVAMCQLNAIRATGAIESVDIIPSLPTEIDEITFNISGWSPTSPSYVEYDQFFEDGSSLQLDLYVNRGFLTATSEWTYSKQISTLPANTYTLELNEYDYYDNSLDHTYIFEFTVVPEPTTLVFFSIGLCIFTNCNRPMLKDI